MPELVADFEFTAKKRGGPSGPRGPRPRDEEQQGYDRDVAQALADRGGVLAYEVKADEDLVAQIDKHVRSAARLLGKGVTVGEPRAGKRKGNVIVSYLVRDVVARGPRNKNSE